MRDCSSETWKEAPFHLFCVVWRRDTRLPLLACTRCCLPLVLSGRTLMWCATGQVEPFLAKPAKVVQHVCVCDLWSCLLCSHLPAMYRHNPAGGIARLRRTLKCCPSVLGFVWIMRETSLCCFSSYRIDWPTTIVLWGGVEDC